MDDLSITVMSSSLCEDWIYDLGMCSTHLWIQKQLPRVNTAQVQLVFSNYYFSWFLIELNIYH